VKGLSVAGIKIDSMWRCWFAESRKAFGYDFRRTADPFSTNYPFSIWIFELRSGVDKFFALKEKNEVSCDILVVWSEVDF
jgi:hypothetical protein